MLPDPQVTGPCNPQIWEATEIRILNLFLYCKETSHLKELMLFAPRGNGRLVAEMARERMEVGGKQTYSLLHEKNIAT